jgi:quinol monooxygenase YgiN
MLLCEEGYRQAMVGTISLYDQEGERQHTTYIAAAPEYGRETFLGRLRREVETVKQLYPNAHYQGLADGAPENWVFLNTVTDTQTLDFYHATQYLDKAAKAIYPHDEQAQKAWMDTRCHSLKHEVGAASRILAEMQTIQPKRVSQSILQGLQDAITYFRNHHLNQQSH